MAIVRTLFFLLSYIANLDLWRWFQNALPAWPTSNQNLDNFLVSARYVDPDLGLDACVENRVKTFLRESSSEDYLRVDDICPDLRQCSDEGLLVLRCKAGQAEFEVQDPDLIDLNELRDRVRLWSEISGEIAE